jgi:hypothetical protein
MTPPDDHAPLAADLRELGNATREPDWAPMEARLLAAFGAPPAPQRRTGAGTIVPGWLAAAAVLLLAAAITWYPLDRGRHGPPPKPADPPRATPPPQPPPPAADKPAAPAKTGARDRGTAARSQAPAPRAPRAPATPFDDFVALPEAAGLPDFESGSIVRVEVPVTMLPAYGLDIEPDASRGAVAADLLVGQDGVPRAIRLAAGEER